jgi:hypothetical protein
VWVVKSLCSVVSASRVDASGWMEGSVVVSAAGQIHSVTEEILTGEHPHEQSGWKEKERKCSI